MPPPSCDLDPEAPCSRIAGASPRGRCYCPERTGRCTCEAAETPKAPSSRTAPRACTIHRHAWSLAWTGNSLVSETMKNSRRACLREREHSPEAISLSISWGPPLSGLPDVGRGVTSVGKVGFIRVRIPKPEAAKPACFRAQRVLNAGLLRLSRLAPHCGTPPTRTRDLARC